MADKRSVLQKLLDLANDKSNKFESFLAFKKYIALKDKLGEENIKDVDEKEWNAFDSSTWCESDKKKYNFRNGEKTEWDYWEEFRDEVWKVPGGYLIRRYNYLNTMSLHFQIQLRELGQESGNIQKYAIKQIQFFENLKMEEFGNENSNWYNVEINRLKVSLIQNLDKKKLGNPKNNYFVFIEDKAKILFEEHIGFNRAKQMNSDIRGLNYF